MSLSERPRGPGRSPVGKDLACVETSWRDSRVAVVRLRGEIDLSNAEDLVSRLSSAAEEAALVVVDLSELRFIGSTGVHALFQISRACATAGGRMCLVVPDGSPINPILNVADMPQTLALYRNVTTAIEENGGRTRGG